MKVSEMKQIVDMLYNEWDLGKKASRAKGKICAWIYLFTILEESEKIIIEKDKNKVIGFCGYSKWNSKRHLIRKKFFKIMKNLCMHSYFIKDKDALYKYYENYSYTPEKLENYFDGEISILIVDENYREKNIGKKLITKIFEYAKKDNMRNIEILTDESCNFKFYEACGCNKIYEKVICNEEQEKIGNIPNEIGYIYEKIF